MNQLHNPKHRLAATGQKACRPHRQALRVCSLHKALRQPNAGPITAPEDVVYECLTFLRRPDLESLAPFLPPGALDSRAPPAGVPVGGHLVREQGPLARCQGFMDTAARRVLPGHLLRRCRVLSSMRLGDTCQQRVALTACTGEEAVFLWRLRRVATAATATSQAGSGAGTGSSTRNAAAGARAGGGAADVTGSDRSAHVDDSRASRPGAADSTASNSTVSSSGAGGDGRLGTSERGYLDSDTTTTTTVSVNRDVAPSSHGRSDAHFSESSSSSSGGSLGPPEAAIPPSPAPPTTKMVRATSAPATTSPPTTTAAPSPTAWIVESISRDASHDDEELPRPSPLGGGSGPHPRVSPELVVKAQLAALRRGDVVGAASYNLWSRSTSGGWDLHLSAFRSLLQQPAYRPLMAAEDAELGPSAMPSPRRMLQEVRLRLPLGSSTRGTRRPAEPQQLGADGGGSGGAAAMVYQLGMQANGCWAVEAIKAV